MKEIVTIVENDTKRYPLGATPTADGMHFSFVYPGKECHLILYEQGKKRQAAKIPFPPENRTGDVWNMTLKGDFQGIEYLFEADGKERSDPWARACAGRERWGDLLRAGRIPRGEALPAGEDFDWGEDKKPEIPYSETIIYRIHVRGFTKHVSSGLEPGLRGTFQGIREKIPYLKELGITTVEILPAAEFEEVMLPPSMAAGACGPEAPDGRLNYWGYTGAALMAPKASYCAGECKEPVRALKELVKALHEAGMELVAELFFTGQESPSCALEAVRRWALDFRADGIRLTGYPPLQLIGTDPYLSRVKLFAASWEGVHQGSCRHLAEYNDGFMTDMRRFLKGDEGQLSQASFHIRSNPERAARINYMANNNGFTMMDMVSYNEKHNEDNGENGRDGTDRNLSWNCGAEGPSRKKQVVRLRRRQLCNAFLMLLLSQGTPLILGGDEFGRTKKGNNNSYCQDHEISWLNWNLLKTNRSLWEFVMTAIAFRKKHPVFHMEKEPVLMDYKSLGVPDLSFHGLKAWCPEFDAPCRELGVFYCGPYGRKADGSSDEYFYVAFNMHWEPREFGLPHLPKGLKWHLAADTARELGEVFLPEGKETLLKDQKKWMAEGRSIVVFMGKQEEKRDVGSESGSISEIM